MEGAVVGAVTGTTEALQPLPPQIARVGEGDGWEEQDGPGTVGGEEEQDAAEGGVSGDAPPLRNPMPQLAQLVHPVLVRMALLPLWLLLLLWW